MTYNWNKILMQIYVNKGLIENDLNDDFMIEIMLDWYVIVKVYHL